MTSKLLERTRQLLASAPMPLAKLAREIECDPKTLYLLRDGKHIPNVMLCEKLYNRLNGSPLEVN